MPSTAMPSASLASMSVTLPVMAGSVGGRPPANCTDSSAARSRTCSVSSSSRQATAIRVSTSISGIER